MVPTRLFNDLIPSVPSFYDDGFSGELMDWNAWNYAGENCTIPAVNIKENEDAWHIEMAAPGMKRKDFKVRFENGKLFLAAENKKDRKRNGRRSHRRREFNYETFCRAIPFPEHSVKVDRISARYADGVLHVTVPKTEPSDSRGIKKQIKIS